MRDEYQNLFVGLEFLLEPDAGFQVQVIGGLVQEEKVGLDEEGAGESDAHPPTSRKLFALFVLHGRVKAQTLEDVGRFGLGCVRTQLVKALVDLHEELLCVVVLARHQSLGKFFQTDLRQKMHLV